MFLDIAEDIIFLSLFSWDFSHDQYQQIELCKALIVHLLKNSLAYLQLCRKQTNLFYVNDTRRLRLMVLEVSGSMISLKSNFFRF